MAVGAVYRVDLASRLQKELGVEIEPDRFAFRIKDVPYRVCREFSKRRLQIEAELKRMGASDAVSASAATQKTRGPAREAKMESLFAAWQKVGEELGFGPREAKRLLHQVTQSHEEKTQEREEQTTGPEQKSTSAENGRKFEEASRSSTKDEFRAKVKEAEQEAYKDLSSKKNFFGLVSQLFPQPYHVRHFEVFIWNKPSVKHGVVVPRKPLLKIPYLVLGPKPQHWGKIRQRILTDKDGELRWQEKILFPKIPGLRGFTEARLRWYRYTKEEKLEAALERERKSHEATKQELNQERKVKAEKQREETEHRRREDERRREEELRRSREQSRSCR